MLEKHVFTLGLNVSGLLLSPKFDLFLESIINNIPMTKMFFRKCFKAKFLEIMSKLDIL
jgi:hypothetical protein